MEALIAGSLFYNAPFTSAGLFVKSGACFFALLFNSILSMSEVNESFGGQPVIIKNKSFALFQPVAFALPKLLPTCLSSLFKSPSSPSFLAVLSRVSHTLTATRIWHHFLTATHAYGENFRNSLGMVGTLRSSSSSSHPVL